MEQLKGYLKAADIIFLLLDLLYVAFLLQHHRVVPAPFYDDSLSLTRFRSKNFYFNAQKCFPLVLFATAQQLYF